MLSRSGSPSPSRRSFLVAAVTLPFGGLLGCGGEPAPPLQSQAVAVAIPTVSAMPSVAPATDPPPPEPPAWNIGVYLSLSGPDAQFGLEAREGIELAVEETNAAGGPQGKRIRLFVQNDASIPGEA